MQRITRRRALTIAASLTAAAALRPQPVRAAENVIIAMQNGIGYLPIIVADALKLFDAQIQAAGIADTTVSVKKFSGAPAINDSLLAGSIQLGAYGAPGLLVAWEKTRGSFDIRGLTPLSMGKYALYTSDPDIRSVKDFTEQSRIAVTSLNSPQALLLRMAGEKAFGDGEIHRFDKMMVQLPHPDATSAMMSGSSTIDGYFANDPFMSILAGNPKLHVVTTSDDILGRPATSGLLATTGRFVEENPEIAKAIVAGIRAAEDAIRAEPAKAAEIYLAAEPIALPREQVTAMIRDNIWSMEPRGVMTYAGFMVRLGMLKAAPESWQDVFFPPVSEGQGD